MNQIVPALKRQSGVVAPQAQLEEQQQYLTFMLGGETFAIGILGIKEIIEYNGLTEVPMMPACIRGVINLRGAVVPVLDLAARFGKPASAVTKKTCIVIVEVESGEERHDMGVVVDAVNAVLEIPRSEIEPPPSFGAKIRSDFIEGMGKVAGKFVILLNVHQVLSTDELGALGQVAAQAEIA
ncbi:chemotaxis protein CheW [Rhodoferax sp.]|uniref:chemotaxis protein CheW n=1 Tax=Rhodoferax sp. TaxID=50421 RepID=UPI0025FF2C70|nr:chemotaxis protein CheW [Rhodoferax sp.]